MEDNLVPGSDRLMPPTLRALLIIQFPSFDRQFALDDKYPACFLSRYGNWYPRNSLLWLTKLHTALRKRLLINIVHDFVAFVLQMRLHINYSGFQQVTLHVLVWVFRFKSCWWFSKCSFELANLNKNFSETETCNDIILPLKIKRLLDHKS